MMHELYIQEINTDPGTQARANMDMDTVIEYADAIVGDGERTWPFPAVTVYFDGAAYWLADGYHRVAAARRVSYPHAIPAVVIAGSRRDAILFAVGANADHGLKRTAADKKSAVKILLRDAEWGKWSDREIARACKVSHTFVAGIRRGLVGIVSGNVSTDNADPREGAGGVGEPEQRMYTTKHGTETTIIYYPVHALQTAVADWLRVGNTDDEARALINSLKATGQAHSRWPAMIAHLPKPHRLNDVRQAVNNVADICRQMSEERKPAEYEARRKTWISVARSMIPICQDYAKTRDYVPEGEGQNHADFHLLAYLRDEYGAQNDLATMQKKLRQMTTSEIRETLRHYANYADDARANVSRWLNQRAGRGETFAATLDAIDAELDADYGRVLAEPEPAPTAPPAAPSDADAYLLTAVRPVALTLPKLSSRQRHTAADYLKNMSSDEAPEIAALFLALSALVRDWRNEA